MTTEEVIDALRRGKALRGISNCHVKNVDSIVLRERVSDYDGLIRVFFARPGHPLDRYYDKSGDFVVMPHNHVYDISIEALHGNILNYKFREVLLDIPAQISRYRFTSAIATGSIGLQYEHQTDLQNPEVVHLGSRIPLQLKDSDIHAMCVSSSVGSWIVREKTIYRKFSYCYSTSREKILSTDGLYQPMTEWQLADSCQQIYEYVREQETLLSRVSKPTKVDL